MGFSRHCLSVPKAWGRPSPRVMQETEVKPTVPPVTSTVPSTRLYWSPRLAMLGVGADRTRP